MGLTFGSMMAGIFAAPHWVGYILGALALLCFIQAFREFKREKSESRPVNWYDVRTSFPSWKSLIESRVPKEKDEDEVD